MLVLSRRYDESVVIEHKGEKIEIMVVSLFKKGNSVQLGFKGNKGCWKVKRKELVR